MITARQIRAARAILGWSQDDLAHAAGLSATTIRNLETGEMSPRPASERAIRQVIEVAGLEFIDQEGVRLMLSDMRVISGANSCDVFYNDMLQVAKNERSEIISVFRSQDLLNQSFNVSQSNHQWLKLLSEITKVKCLMSESHARPDALPPFDIRLISKSQIGAISYFVYGNKHAIVLPEGSNSIRFMVYSSITLAEVHRSHFALLWDHAIVTHKHNRAEPVKKHMMV